MITKWDKAVIAVFIILAVLSYLGVNYFILKDNPSEAIITVDGKEYARYNLTEITEEKIIEVKTEYGENTVMISDGEVRVTKASCPDRLDVRAEAISKSGQTIVCLPNRFSVSLMGKSKTVDKVAY